MPELFNFNGAVFSQDRFYRYYLWRIWDESKPFILFIGLNPSKADESKNDPTITRVIQFARSWGYGGAYMMNLFAYVTTDPKILRYADNPIGPDNDKYYDIISAKCKDVLFAWGSFPEAKERAVQVIQRFPEALALEINKDGSPKHPLYVAGSTQPIKFQLNSISI